MMEFTLKRKLYTKYDETDNLKRMKDSDILAEKKRPTNNYGEIGRNAAMGAAAAGAAGTIIGGFTKRPTGAVKGIRGIPSAMGRGGVKGAMVGGILGAGVAYASGRNKAKENQFYNERLSYAQTQARRREKKDWKTNMTQRDGYSY